MTKLKLNTLEKESKEIILEEAVRGMSVGQREEVLDRYATCLDCTVKNNLTSNGSCNFCFYKNYKLI